MKAKSVVITPVLNGFIVKVGCQEIVFQSLGYLTREIERYYKNPEIVEREYLENAVNKLDTVLEIERPVDIGTLAPHIGNIRDR